MSDQLTVHDEYTRDDVAQAFGEGHGQGGKWMSGVVPVGDDELALFVTLDKSSYSGEHRYEDAFESPSVLRWQSQTRASPDNGWGKKHINGGPDQRPHHIFVRTKSGKPFVYCGQARYQKHEGSKPMTIWWELLESLPEERFNAFQEATDHAGGRVPPAHVKSRELGMEPPAPDLRSVPGASEIRSDDIDEEPEVSPLEIEEPPWGWAGSLDKFLSMDEDTIIESLEDHHDRRFVDLPLGYDQREAWKRTIEVFQDALRPLRECPGGPETLVVFEYELPGEGGRRPDLVLVTPSQEIFVIECKNQASVGSADLDQALRYKKDLEEYHSESPEHRVHGVLALLKESSRVPPLAEGSPVLCVTPDRDVFQELLGQIETSLEEGGDYEPERWLLGDYAPLPHLVEAVRATFEEQPLPRLKSVRSSNVPLALDRIEQVAEEARDKSQHVLILVTGAPGSGKTLVGVESTIRAVKRGMDALFLSGNGPLVAVLQDAFDRAGSEGAARSLIRHMFKFKQGVTRNVNSTPAHVYVFDEGQRAWDEAEDFDGSEIELLIEVASRQDWGVVLGLIGEGQEIYKKEDGGLQTWLRDFETAEKHGKSWRVLMPDRDFPGENLRESHRQAGVLHLASNIRAKSAHRLHEWVEAVLEGDADLAGEIAFELQEAGYPIHVTPNRSTAERYVHQLFEDVPDPRYGWLISSEHRKGRDPEGMSAPYVRTWQNKDVWGPWFNSPADDPASCCQLEMPCPEFSCQGLELDFALVFWGDDLEWRDGEWHVRRGVRSWSDTPVEHTLNAYRVLMTRGREGMLIRCKDDETREFLERCGAEVLVDN